jgi:hypothetical protein
MKEDPRTQPPRTILIDADLHARLRKQSFQLAIPIREVASEALRRALDQPDRTTSTPA